MSKHNGARMGSFYILEVRNIVFKTARIMNNIYLYLKSNGRFEVKRFYIDIIFIGTYS